VKIYKNTVTYLLIKFQPQFQFRRFQGVEFCPKHALFGFAQIGIMQGSSQNWTKFKNWKHILYMFALSFWYTIDQL